MSTLTGWAKVQVSSTRRATGPWLCTMWKPGGAWTGEARPGERLPSALDLASVLKVNRNTVLRALRQLRDEGLLEVRRGRGVTVVATPEQGELHARVRELVEFARRHGFRRDELVDLIRAVYPRAGSSRWR
jgi:GntR family transcriptional regulator